MSGDCGCDGDRSGFVFSLENLSKAREIMARYPADKKESAVLPLLDLAQRQNGNSLTCVILRYVARFLDMPETRIQEIATFYTMFNLQPVGKHVISVCRTTPCWLRGSEDILKICKEKLGIGIGETTADGRFTLRECECLGACANAPVVQMNDDYFEDLTPELMAKLIDEMIYGNTPKTGSQTQRVSSSPRSKDKGSS